MTESDHSVYWISLHFTSATLRIRGQIAVSAENHRARECVWKILQSAHFNLIISKKNDIKEHKSGILTADFNKKITWGIEMNNAHALFGHLAWTQISQCRNVTVWLKNEIQSIKGRGWRDRAAGKILKGRCGCSNNVTKQSQIPFKSSLLGNYSNGDRRIPLDVKRTSGRPKTHTLTLLRLLGLLWCSFFFFFTSVVI